LLGRQGLAPIRKPAAGLAGAHQGGIYDVIAGADKSFDLSPPFH
jgi:Holliday junction resolvase